VELLCACNRLARDSTHTENAGNATSIAVAQDETALSIP